MWRPPSQQHWHLGGEHARLVLAPCLFFVVRCPKESAVAAVEAPGAALSNRLLFIISHLPVRRQFLTMDLGQWTPPCLIGCQHFVPAALLKGFEMSVTSGRRDGFTAPLGFPRRARVGKKATTDDSHRQGSVHPLHAHSHRSPAGTRIASAVRFCNPTRRRTTHIWVCVMIVEERILHVIY